MHVQCTAIKYNIVWQMHSESISFKFSFVAILKADAVYCRKV